MKKKLTAKDFDGSGVIIHHGDGTLLHWFNAFYTLDYDKTSSRRGIINVYTEHMGRHKIPFNEDVTVFRVSR